MGRGYCRNGFTYISNYQFLTDIGLTSSLARIAPDRGKVSILFRCVRLYGHRSVGWVGLINRNGRREVVALSGTLVALRQSEKSNLSSNSALVVTTNSRTCP